MQLWLSVCSLAWGTSTRGPRAPMSREILDGEIARSRDRQMVAQRPVASGSSAVTTCWDLLMVRCWASSVVCPIWYPIASFPSCVSSAAPLLILFLLGDLGDAKKV